METNKLIYTVDMSGVTLYPWQIDNLSTEFFGKVIIDKSDDKIMSFEFGKVEHMNEFQNALLCFTRPTE